MSFSGPQSLRSKDGALFVRRNINACLQQSSMAVVMSAVCVQVRYRRIKSLVLGAAFAFANER